MSIMQNKRFRIGIGVAAIVIAAAAIGAGTYANFSDVETGPGGAIQSGTLDLEVGGGASTTLFDASNIAPGYTRDVVVTLNNVGSIPGTLTSTLTAVGTNVTCTEPELAQEGGTTCAGNLQDQLQVAIIPPGSSTPGASVTMGSLTTLGAGVTIPANGSVVYTLRITFPSVAGTVNNAAQGDRVVLTSNFTLTQ